MQSFKQRVLDKIGDTVTTGDLAVTGTMISDWTNEGAKAIIGKMPKPLWHFFAKGSAAFAPTTGTAIESQKIINVFRSDGTINQPCRMIPETLKGRALDSSEVNYATTTDPAAYVDFSTTATPTLKILPVSATAVGYVTYVNFPTIAPATDTVINGFPNDLEPLVVDYAVTQVKIREMGISRRDAQAEIEAITDTGILAGLATVYTDIETALDASTTQNAKISTILDLANVEFDKMSAIIDLGNVEIDKVPLIIDEANTALDLVSTTVTTANTEFDLMKTHVATSVTTISTGEDIEKGGSQLSMAQTAGATGDKYLAEGAMNLQKAQASMAEAQRRLENAQSYIQESEARKSTGAAYIDEALARAKESSSFLAEAASRIGKGQLLLGECQVRLGTAQGYMGQSAQASGDYQIIQKNFDENLKMWISVNL